MRTMKYLASLLLLITLAGSASAIVLDENSTAVKSTADVVCVDHYAQTSMPYRSWGLWDFYPDIRTKGDFTYIFDGDHLDCLDFSDPYVLNVVSYTPSIDLTPNPERLLKVGSNHLYAFQPGVMSIIDITTANSPALASQNTTWFTGTTPPTAYDRAGDVLCLYDAGELKFLNVTNPAAPSLITTVQVSGTGAPTLVGTFDGAYMYFYDDETIKVVDCSSPGSVSLIALIAAPALYDYYWPNFFVHADRIFVIHSGYPSNLVIVNIADPGAPFGLYPDMNDYPFAWDFGSWAEPLYLNENKIVIRFHDLPGDWERCYDVSDPDNWEESWEWPSVPEYTPGGATEGDRTFWGTSGSYEYPYTYGQIHPATELPYTYGNWRYPFVKPAISDNALIFASAAAEPNWPGGVQGKLIVMPRQCEFPSLVGTVEIGRTYLPNLDVIWEITWETDMYTSAELDRVVIRDQLPNPPDGMVGTITLVGWGTVEEMPTGNYLHTVTYNMGECVPLSSYYVDVYSTRTGNVASSVDNVVRIKYCAQTLADAPTPEFELTASPNPFNPSTTFSFEVPQGAAVVDLNIYDLSGRLVKKVYSASQSEGVVSRTWLGDDSAGKRVSSGVYFAILKIDDEKTSRKLILLK